MPSFFRGDRRRKSVIAAAVAVAAAAVALFPQVSAGAATATPDPSGEAPPASGWWQSSFVDEFDGTAINKSAWGVYDNHDPRNPHGPKYASNVSVHDGMATLRTTKVNGVWAGSGICSAKMTTGTYGKYMVRARFMSGLGVKAVALLWPSGNHWPPEVDFMEYDARDAHHKSLLLTNHFRPLNSMQQAFVSGDYTQWHTFGVAWTPTYLRFFLDGKTTAIMKGHVPTAQMWLGLQTAIGGQVKPDATTPAKVDLDVDWVAYYSAPADAGWTP